MSSRKTKFINIIIAITYENNLDKQYLLPQHSKYIALILLLISPMPINLIKQPPKKLCILFILEMGIYLRTNLL